MIYRDYGRTGKKVSALGFGGMRFKDIEDRDACVRTMLAAAEGGVTYFDTAQGYNGGKSEEVFGEAFAEFRRRGLEYYCATKTSQSTEDGIRQAIDEQLGRLKIDAIDFYHIWCVTDLENWQERKANGVIRTFQKLKEEGLIRHICVSSHLIGDRIRELLNEGVFEGVLFGYSAYNFKTRQAAFDVIAREKLGAVVMNPLGGGLIPQNPELFEFVKTQKDETVVEAALRFLWAHADITVALVGCRDENDVRDALGAMEGYRRISDAQMTRIRSAAGDAFENICTGCQYCDNCPEGIRIPKLMDAYNHKLLYGEDQGMLGRLRYHWGVPYAEAAKCVECGQCEEECTQHLPIISRLKEIVEIGEKADAQAAKG